MKILILSKRAPQQKDLWERPYGRFYHLAKYLAAKGHSVDLVLLNFDRGNEFKTERDGMTWHSVNLMPNPLRFFSYANKFSGSNKPDWIIGFSDSWFGILAVLLARCSGAKSLIDAYDNYESYIPWCWPLHWLWRFSLRKACCVTAPGNTLLEKMSAGRLENSAGCILPMCADDQFVVSDKHEARKKLGLPQDKKLIGYCGSVHDSRGMEILFDAIRQLSKKHNNYVFVMSGNVQNHIILPENVQHLGYIEDVMMPIMFNALDVMVSLSKPSDFGSYSYPVKIYEALACGVPVIASATLSVSEIMDGDETGLFEAESAHALAGKLEQLLSGSVSYDVPVKERWEAVAARLDKCITGLSRH